MSVAPSCPISTSQPTQKSRPSVVDIANIPPAHDLRSVITAINQMNNLVQHITRGTPQINNVYPTTVIGVPQPESPPNPTVEYGQVSWREVSRHYNDREVVNPDDPDQKIKIKTLAVIEWRDMFTGHTVRYEGPA